MEAISLAGLAAVATGAVFGFAVCRCIADGVNRQILRSAYLRRIGIEEGLGSRSIRNGITVFMTLAKKVECISCFERWFASLAQASSFAGCPTTPQRVGSFALCMGAGLFVVLLVAFGPVVAIATCICVYLGCNAAVAAAASKRREALRDSLPSALQSLQACFLAGYSLEQALSQVSREVEGPLGRVFEESVAVYEAGGTIEESLEHLKNATNESELVFLATALEIQHRSGSSMQQVLSVARESVEDEIALKRSLRTQTAQAKLSARIVTAMPFLLIAVFSIVSPRFLDPFFSSLAGMATLTVALAMQAMGVYLVHRMLNVEVSR